MPGSLTTLDLPPVLKRLAGVSPIEEADALDFFGVAGLPLASVALGLLEQSDDCIKIVDLEGRLQYMNCNGRKAMQIDDFAAFAGLPWQSFWPADTQAAVEQSVSEARDGRTYRFEAFCSTAKGEPRWWEVTVSPLRGGDGRVVAILSLSRDISERWQRTQALETVALEMKHRLRNAHTVGAAIAMAASRDLPEHRAFGNELAARLSRLADVQADLLDTTEGLTLRQLCVRAVSAFELAETNVECLGGDEIALSEQGARTLALVLGELATNSAKYGALGRRGKVQIESSRDDGMLSLVWNESLADTGAAAPLSAASGGQGAGLMRRMLSLLDGQIEAVSTGDGYQAVINLPLAKVTR